MIEKIKSFIWFAKRPSFWAQAVELVKRKFRPNRDGDDAVAQATAWAAERSVSIPEALAKVGIAKTDQAIPSMDAALISEGEERAAKSRIKMGGPGDLGLIFGAVALSDAKNIVETGVAYGWSSLAILSALGEREDATLISVDMPYPKMNNEEFVAIVVPDRFKKKHTLIREPDRNGLKKAVAAFGGSVDLCHYDSDKSWWGRKYATPIMWEALKSGGIFIADDI